MHQADFIAGADGARIERDLRLVEKQFPIPRCRLWQRLKCIDPRERIQSAREKRKLSNIGADVDYGTRGKRRENRPVLNGGCHALAKPTPVMG